MKRLQILIGLVAVFYVMPVHAEGKQQDVKRVLEIVDTIAHLAETDAHLQADDPNFKADTKKRVTELIAARSPSSSQLGKLALISWTLYNPGDAVDVGYDEPYYAAFWSCVELLCKEQTKENYLTLTFIKDHAHLDAGEHLMFDNLFGPFEQQIIKAKKNQ
jgi:hypothetical protein